MSPRPPVRLRILPLLLLGLASLAYVSRPRAPENLVSLEYTFASAGARQVVDGVSTDASLSGLGLTWETFAVTRDSNLAVSWLQWRSGRASSVSRTIDASVLRLQWRWQWPIPRMKDWSWYVGPGLGWVVSASESPKGSTSYDGGLYLDAEAGFRYQLFDPVGLVGIINIAYLDVNGRNAASLVDQAASMSFALGIYADF
jgi:hypothetical protein